MTRNDPSTPANELDARAPWRGAADEIAPSNLDEWYRGSTIDILPSKPKLAAQGMEALLLGWMPQSPIIRKQTRVIGVGSCFASYFMLWLADSGFNRSLPSSAHNALIRYGSSFENAAVIAQQFRWAFEGLDSSDLKWIGKDKEVFEASEERRQLVRSTLEQTDVLIVTLGLSEIWYDQQTGEPLWRALTRRHYDPRRHVFRIETLADTKRALEKIEAIRRKHLPDMKIVFTVSPVRLRATFRPISALSANSASKAILRAALDEFLRERPEQLNSQLFYFPSFEMVQDFFQDPFEVDNRHVTEFVAARIVRCFARNFCDPSIWQASAGAGADAPAASQGDAGSTEELRARVAALESRAEELQRICDERMQVIAGLDTAARERLETVESLSRECARLNDLLRSK